MRNADYARDDAKNILAEKHKDLLGTITHRIESAVTEGKFKVVVCFGRSLPSETTEFLKSAIRREGYKVDSTNTQCDGTTLIIDWREPVTW